MECARRCVLLLASLMVPGASATLSPMLHIDWERLPDYPAQGPQGNLGSNGGWVDDTTVLSAFGYAAGQVFTNSSFVLNFSSTKKAWERIPSAPVTPRQDVGATKVGDSFYFLGGFSYTSPFTYKDVLRLRPIDVSPWWEWSHLPDFPYPVDASTALVSVGSKLFVFGGMDYDGHAFYVAHDRHNGTLGLGKRLYCFDTATNDSTWQRLPDLPSVPRWLNSLSTIGDELYVIGGATGSNPEHKITTLVDNWKFNTLTHEWTQLSSLPIASGNFNSGAVFSDRYILLIGGYQHDNTTLPNGTNIQSYGNPQRLCNQASKLKDAHCRQGCVADTTDEYFNDIFVYDTQTDTYGVVSASSKAEACLLPPGCGPYPLNVNIPQQSVRGNRIFTVGGEADARTICGSEYQHYPTLALLGTISVAGNQDSTSVYL